MTREPNSRGTHVAMKLKTQIHLEVDTDGDDELQQRILDIAQQEVMRYSAAVADRLEEEGITDVEIEVGGRTRATNHAVRGSNRRRWRHEKHDDAHRDRDPALARPRGARPVHRSPENDETRLGGGLS